jgi:hypothetical protein
MARDWSVSATASERGQGRSFSRRFAGPGLFEVAERFAVMDASHRKYENRSSYGLNLCAFA